MCDVIRAESKISRFKFPMNPVSTMTQLLFSVALAVTAQAGRAWRARYVLGIVPDTSSFPRKRLRITLLYSIQ